MKNRKKVVMLALIVLLCATAFASACSNKGNTNSNSSNTPAATNESNNVAANEPASEEEELAPVELTWYVPGPGAQPDQEAVMAEINKYLQEKINTTLKLIPVEFGSYDQKMNVVLSSGEEFDMAFSTLGWVLKYQENIGKGAFLPVDDLLAKYAPNLKDNTMPVKFWDDLKGPDGKIYGVPNYQIAAKARGFVVQKDIAAKYGLDPATVKTLADMEPFFEKVKNGEPDMIPFATKDDFFASDKYTGPVTVARDDKTYTIVNFNETPEYKAYLDLAHSWYSKGYINKDAATIKELDPLIKTGKAAAIFDMTMKPGGEAELASKFGGKEVIYVPLTQPEYTGVSGAITVINKKSKNPERAMMFLELMNSDKYLYNLICYGLENKHYKKLDDTFIELIPDSGYFPNTSWTFGNQFNAYLLKGQDPEVWNKTKALNESAFVPDTFGFVFDNSSVQAQQANVSAVEQEYYRGLATGMIDPAEHLPKFLAKLKAAGIDELIAEKQKQLDVFLKGRGLK